MNANDSANTSVISSKIKLKDFKDVLKRKTPIQMNEEDRLDFARRASV